MEIETTTQNRIIRLLITSVVMVLFAVMFWPFLTPLLLAALFAFAFEKIVTRYTLKYKKSRVLVTSILLVLLCLFVVAPLVGVVIRTVSSIKEASSAGLQNSPIYQMLEQFLVGISDKINTLAHNFDIDTSHLPQLGDILSKSSQAIASYATEFVTAIPDTTMSLLVFLASLYYFLVEAKTIKKTFVSLNILNRSELNQLIEIVKKSSYITIVASALVGALQATIVATFGYFCGYDAFMILFVLTFIFSLIPVVGAAPVALILAFLSFLQGHGGATVALIIGALIAGSIDNVVKPMIVSSSSEDLHPILSLLALVGAIIVYGAPGILLGPILTQLALKIIPILFPNNEPVEDDG